MPQFQIGQRVIIVADPANDWLEEITGVVKCYEYSKYIGTTPPTDGQDFSYSIEVGGPDSPLMGIPEDWLRAADGESATIGGAIPDDGAPPFQDSTRSGIAPEQS